MGGESGSHSVNPSLDKASNPKFLASFVAAISK
jgi:hypothetical protein